MMFRNNFIDLNTDYQWLLAERIALFICLLIVDEVW